MIDDLMIEDLMIETPPPPLNYRIFFKKIHMDHKYGYIYILSSFSPKRKTCHYSLSSILFYQSYSWFLLITLGCLGG